MNTRDNIWDIEAYSGGSAITGERFIEATSYRNGTWPQERMRHLLDGKLTSGPEDKRAPLFESKGGGPNVCIEVDLKTSHNITEVKVARPQAPLGTPRVVSVLDEHRKIVGSAVLTLTQENATELDFRLDANGPHVGETLPVGTRAWLPFSEFAPDYPVPEPPDSAERLAAFEARNTPQSVEKLAKRFFGLMDLRLPHLAAVRAAYEGGKYSEALALYRDLWFKRIAGTKNLWGNEIAGSRYVNEADDLMKNKFGMGHIRSDGKGRVVMVPFKPGLIQWGFIPPDELRGAFLEWNHGAALANHFGRSLLAAYRKTGDPKYLDRWEAVTDDHNMNFFRAADASEVDLRDFFVKETLQNWNFFVFELAETAQHQPEFISRLSPETLARILITGQEEYLVPYWRVARKAVFNHTFNALNAAYSAVESFRDFTAGERMMRETREHLERVTSYNTTRDGSMTEIGDDGHIDMHMRLGISLFDIFARKPDWLSPVLVRQLTDRYAEMTRFQIRHQTANGLSHRIYKDSADRVLLVDPNNRTRGGWEIPEDYYEDVSVYKEPEVRSILEAIYDKRSPGERLRKFYGGQKAGLAAPRVISDFMPYAGLYYLRGGWGGDYSSAHMMSPPTGHPSSNPVDQTCIFFVGKGVPMLYLGGVVLDRDEPNVSLGEPLEKPGSKTERLTESAPNPLNVRWYSGRDFDLAEALWQGPYGKGSVKDPETQAYGKVETRRFLVQYRPADLWVSVDRIEIGEHASKTPRNYRFNVKVTAPDDGSVETGADSNALDLIPGKYAGMESRFFASTPVTVNAGRGGKKGLRIRSTLFGKTTWEEKNFEVTAEGGRTFAGLMLIHPRRDGEADVAVKAKAVSSLGEGNAGFKMPLPGGGEMAVFVAGGKTKKFSLGQVSAEASLLVVVNDSKGPRGLVLDAASFGGRPVAEGARDFAFESGPGGLKMTPILRPLQLPVIAPGAPVFIGQTTITLTAPDKDARIYYTLDESDPVPGAPGTTLYTAPFPIDKSTLVKARTVRGELSPGSFTPFRVDGTLYSEIQYAAFEKKEPLPAASVNAATLQPGLKMDFLQDSWRRLFSFLNNPAEMPAQKTVTVKGLLDPADFTPLREDNRYFGVRYNGYLNVPAEGVYTFHPPVEMAHDRSAVPGYDLQVFIDGVAWDPDFTWQGGGNWSVALAKGPHQIQIAYADVRTREKICPNTGLWRGFPANHVVWKGEVPVLKISGPGIADPQPIPTEWFKLR